MLISNNTISLQKKFIKMKNFFRRFAFITALFLLFSLNSQKTSAESGFEVSKQFEILHSLYSTLDYYYVDTVNVKKAFQSAIDGMLSTIDPYTNYFPENKTDDMKFITTGDYGGVGAVIGERGDSVIVIKLYKDMPADKAGLMPGDIFLSVDGHKINKSNVRKVSEYLKGEPGTKLNVVVSRPGTDKPMKKELIRRLVTINPVSYYGMVNDSIGYINFMSFTDKSAREVHKAFDALKKKGMKSLIFDLRGNGGGLLDQAVSICNLFVPNDQVIVTTKGKVHDWDQIYKTTEQPVDTIMPIVVLVNNGTASAAEILSGSMQDLDRAVVMGGKTYGKGLVQTTRALPYDALLKVTTAKYYIPSGRCIQAIDYSHRNPDGSVGRIPDSLTTVFHTKNGRPVKDGGGIAPDIKLPYHKASMLAIELSRKFYLFDYANKFRQEHSEVESPDKFKLTDAEYNKFIEYLKDKKFTYKKQSISILSRLKKEIEAEGYADALSGDLKTLEQKLKGDSISADMNRKKGEIAPVLGSEIVERYYYEGGGIEYSLQFDKWIAAAKKLLEDPVRYDSILSPVVDSIVVSDSAGVSGE